MANRCTHIPEMMLPRKGTDLSKWAVIACDQYTSQPEYWAETDRTVGDAPSTLRLTLPEVYVTARPNSDGGKEPIGQSEAESIRVGLFKNRSLIAWLDPCEQPEHFHGEYGGESFYHLPEGVRATLTKDTDQLQFAAVVTDSYGRQEVYSDIPYMLSDGALTWPDSSNTSDHDPANWDYGQ